jgi:hypothetical protein
VSATNAATAIGAIVSRRAVVCEIPHSSASSRIHEAAVSARRRAAIQVIVVMDPPKHGVSRAVHTRCCHIVDVVV